MYIYIFFIIYSNILYTYIYVFQSYNIYIYIYYMCIYVYNIYIYIYTELAQLSLNEQIQKL